MQIFYFFLSPYVKFWFLGIPRIDLTGRLESVNSTYSHIDEFCVASFYFSVNLLSLVLYLRHKICRIATVLYSYLYNTLNNYYFIIILYKYQK